MTREEAARILHPDTYSRESDKIADGIEWAFMVDKAARMGAEALREGWIKTEDRVPFEEDASDDGLVLAITASRNGKKWRLEGRHWKDLWKVNNPEYWASLTISLPPLPEVNE